MTSAQTVNHEQRTTITPAEMNRLIEQHIAAEIANDSAGAVAMYTDDVIHDDVGAAHGPLHGPDAAKGFYDFLGANFRTERMDVNHAWYGDEFCVIEHQCTGTATGELIGIPGNGKRIAFACSTSGNSKPGSSRARTCGSTAPRSWHSSPAEPTPLRGTDVTPRASGTRDIQSERLGQRLSRRTSSHTTHPDNQPTTPGRFNTSAGDK